MDTIFINSENSRTLNLHILTLKLTNKLDLRFGEKGYCFIKSQYLLYMEKQKAYTIIINLNICTNLEW